jgi:hypothetical protein
MEREMGRRIDRAQAGTRRRIARTEAGCKEARRSVRLTERALFSARTFAGLALLLALLAAQRMRLGWLGCRRVTLEARLEEVRQRAVREWHEEAARRERAAERERRRRVREAAAEVRRRHGGRPVLVCGREPRTWEELSLAEHSLSGAEGRHRVCLAAWRKRGGAHEVRVRERLERDMPLRQYERKMASERVREGRRAP